MTRATNLLVRVLDENGSPTAARVSIWSKPRNLSSLSSHRDTRAESSPVRHLELEGFETVFPRDCLGV